MDTALRPPRCLVIAPNWVGDTVMDALAESERRVAVLAKPHLHSILRLSPAVSEIVERSGSTAETIDRLRRGSFEEAVLLPNSFRAAWLVHRAGIPNRWGYRADGRSLLLRPAVHRASGAMHQLRDYDRLLERMGVAPIEAPPRLPLNPEVESQGLDALQRAGVETGTGAPLVGLFPGAEFGPSKRWQLDDFARTALALEERRPRAQPILVVGPKESPLAITIQHAAGRDFPVVGPDLDLAALGGLLSRLDALITNDSGPMHLAAAVGTRCVAVFGPTNPRLTSPSGPGHRVLSANRWCAPCFRKRCPLIRHRCMTEIRVGSVVDAVDRILSAPPPPA